MHGHAKVSAIGGRAQERGVELPGKRFAVTTPHRGRDAKLWRKLTPQGVTNAALEGYNAENQDRRMAASSNPGVQGVIPMRELKWSPAEKTVARRAFDLALGKELEALIL
jgi:hypothetical protein